MSLGNVGIMFTNHTGGYCSHADSGMELENGEDSYRVGVPVPGEWEVLISSADPSMEGTVIHTEKIPWSGQQQFLAVKLPTTCGMILKHLRRND